MNEYDQAAHHAQQLAWQQEAERILQEATRRPLTVDEAKLLAWAAQLQFKENSNEMDR